MLDLKICGGRVLDGTGAEPRRADVGIRGERIEAVGDLARAAARDELNAAGCYVCPGFVDAHSHSDTYLLIEPSAPSKIFQGVTTEIVGQCGASAAPRFGAHRLPADWREKHYPGEWSTVAEYRDLLERQRPAPNVVLFVGHNTLRASVMGYAPRPATETEIEAMRRALEAALDEGAAGLSTGLLYEPGRHAQSDEILALARVAAARGGVYASHLRNEGSRWLEALEEVLSVARAVGARVQISHLKTSGRRNWALLDQGLARIAGARAEGLAVAADRYPYTRSSTDLDVILPAWATAGGADAIRERLKDPPTRARIREALEACSRPSRWRQIWVGTTYHPENHRFRGRTLAEVAQEMALPPAEAVLRLLERDDLKTTAVFAGMSEKNMWTILAQPYVMIGTDASLRALTGPLSTDHPHPRAYGTFPRLLRASLDAKTVPLPELVRKMTSLPAEHFGLRGRGVLRPGAFADVVVFDPGTVRDRATYRTPHRLARGVQAVVVNGVVTLRDGKLTGARGGRFLAPAKP